MENLDSIDLKLLKLLQTNSRLTTKELATEVGLSISPVYERVKRLESDGYIDRYVALLNPEKLNLSFIVYVAVKLNKQSNPSAEEFISVVQSISEVTECYSVAGRFDFLMKVYAPDMNYYRSFVLDVLGGIDTIGNIESTFVMAEVKQTTALPLRQLS
ncbi:MAG: Lrp/AsnC family transcriptional regulator [Muribaculaceae bacterium]|nr:Lrp/AsnC family transcriptional regulator [Muribaculaceae bacterium]